MYGQCKHDWLRLLVGFLALLTIAGQILEAERAPDIPALSMTLRGTKVHSIISGGAADLAGFRAGDILLKIDQHAISSANSPHAYIENYEIGRSVSMFVERGGKRFWIALRMQPPTDVKLMMRLVLAAVGILTILIGLVVYFKKPILLSTIFMGICYSLGFVIYAPYLPPIPELMLGKMVLSESLSLAIPPLFLHLFLLFPFRNMILENHPRLLWLLYLPSFILMIFFQICRLMGPSAPPIFAELGHQVMGLLWVAGMGAALWLFIQSYRRARHSTIAKAAMRAVLIGTILGLTPVTLMVILHQLWPAISFPGDRLAVIFLVLIPLSFGYAIVRHGIFDATYLVRRSLVMTVAGALILIAYFACYLLFRYLLFPGTTISSLWISFLSMVIAGSVFMLIRCRVQSTLSKALGGERRDTGSLLYDLSMALRGVTARRKQVRLVTECMNEALCSGCNAFFEPLTSSNLEIAYIDGLPLEKMHRYRFSSVLSRKLARLHRPIDRGDLEVDLPFGYISPSDQKILDTLDTEMIVPLCSQDKFQGVILVGRRTQGDMFTSDDMRLAETISAEGSMALRNTYLQEKIRLHEDIRNDVKSARDLQERLLPTELPKIPSMEIDGFSLAAAGVGGDYYDCFRTPWGELVFAIGDVSGKGVSGAILMANLQALVRGEGKRREPAEKIVGRINTRLCEMEKPDRFVTFGFVRIDPLTGNLGYCNAGHTSFVLVRSGGEIEELSIGGLPLGIMTEATYAGAKTTMRSGDLLMLYTDGITERWSNQEMFGEARLYELVSKHQRKSAQALKEIILAAVKGFSSTPLDDDTSLLLIKML